MNNEMDPFMSKLFNFEVRNGGSHFLNNILKSKNSNNVRYFKILSPFPMNSDIEIKINLK